MNPAKQTRKLLMTLRTMPEYRQIESIYFLDPKLSGNMNYEYCIHLPLPRKQQNEFLEKLENKLPDEYHISIYDQLSLKERKQSYKGKLIHFKNKQNAYSAAIRTMRQFKNR